MTDERLEILCREIPDGKRLLRAVLLGQLWEELLEQIESAHLLIIPEDGVSLTVQHVRRGRLHLQRSSLSAALLALLAREETRVCTGCNTPKPLEQFSVMRDGTGGRNARCKRCEVERMTEHRRQKRAAEKRPQPAQEARTSRSKRPKAASMSRAKSLASIHRSK